MRTATASAFAHSGGLCDEVRLYLACRWLCRLEPDGDDQDHSTRSKKIPARLRNIAFDFH